MVHCRQARQQDLLLRQLRQCAYELGADIRGDGHRLVLDQAASASGAISSSERPRVSSPSPLTAIAGMRTGVRYGPMIPPTRPTAAATPEPVARTDVA